MSGILESAAVVIISKKAEWVRWQPIKTEHEATREPEEQSEDGRAVSADYRSFSKPLRFSLLSENENGCALVSL